MEATGCVAEDSVNAVKQCNHCLSNVKVKLCVLGGGRIGGGK